ncbi:hypothetical protein [Burkholderia ubonensis]|uniref:hypothetical protein n=1 Tax=Burkholderia ubonensis TaxID=101571 RepID=UPI001E28A91C|nr:hypothetical protein [Burkholderia ubonensis]
MESLHTAGVISDYGHAIQSDIFCGCLQGHTGPMSRSPARPSRRKPLTREMLLPLPVSKVRALSLENHLALAAMRTGSGNVDQMSCLLKVVYLAWFLLDDPATEHAQVFRDAEAALERSSTRAQRREGWILPEDDCTAIEQILVLHDDQLAPLASHRYTSAWTSLTQFVASPKQSPLPVARNNVPDVQHDAH